MPKQQKQEKLDSLDTSKLKNKIKRRLINIVTTLSIIGLLCIVCYNFVGWLYRVDSNDMYPMLQDGDLVLTSKLGSVNAKDIVVYEIDDKIYFGRVFGIEGDVVEIRDDEYLTLNGTLPYETNIFYPTVPKDESIKYPLTIKDEYVFVLGDYRQNSKDSRYFGEIPISSIKGRVVFLLLRQRGLVN